jgi:hypothetical protein
VSPADLEVLLEDRPGALAGFGQVLGAAGVSLEGGGVFVHDGIGIAHFLVGEPERARRALEEHGVGPVRVNPVVMLRLDQEVPGQLGAFTRRLAREGINLRVQYSDHDGHLVLVVDPSQHERCAALAATWDRERARPGPVL